MFDSFLDLLSPGLEGVFTFLCAMCFLFSPLIDLEKILLSAIIQISTILLLRCVTERTML